VHVAVDRGGSFGRVRALPRNWMHARPPGIAFARRPAESSPVDSASVSVRTSRRRIALVIAGASFAVGISLTGDALWLHAKALLAQALLHRAWTQTQATGIAAEPWPWADTVPIARLIAPAHDVDLLVLAGATGRTLAFGPGHHDGSAPLGAHGNAVISAHRDTHFRFLRTLVRGDALIVEAPSGARYHYFVRDAFVADARTLELPRLPREPTLTLVTCWPFDAVTPGGSLRYVVIATADDATM
jgi:sortase A